MVLTLVNGIYQESVFRAQESIVSPLFPALAITAERLLHPEE